MRTILFGAALGIVLAGCASNDGTAKEGAGATGGSVQPDSSIGGGVGGSIGGSGGTGGAGAADVSVGGGGAGAAGGAGGAGAADVSVGGGGAGGAGGDARAGGASGSDGAVARGPAYDAGTADCPAADGTRRIKLVNNCTETRWFKLDGRTTPTWAQTNDCPWAGKPCTVLDDVDECSTIAKSVSGAVDPGLVYCKAAAAGGAGTCACNPFFKLEPGEAHEIVMPATAAFPSGTGWLATGCNAWGNLCSVGNYAGKNSEFEFSYDAVGKGFLFYDISAVNAWTTASSVGMKSCNSAGSVGRENDPFWCGGTGCRFDVNTQCPDGTDTFAAAPSGCRDCPTKIDATGKKVPDGPCGPCPDGNSANGIPTGTVFDANNVGGDEWTWLGPAGFAKGWGYAEGSRANRRYSCGMIDCTVAQPGKATSCLGGCDLCVVASKAGPGDPGCIKYCCPDGFQTYGAFKFRYDSVGCTALGVQPGTDYTVALKTECPYVYTYAYEDHSSTFVCDTGASLLVQTCPDPVDFPSQPKR